MAEPTTQTQGASRAEPRPLTREERRELFRLDRVRALSALLGTRAELRGVSAVADHLDDAVRWSV